MASLVGQVLHICLGLTAGQYDKCFFPLRFVWSVKVNDEYLAYRPNVIFLFFLLILLVPYMLSFIRSSFLRIRGMMPSRPIYKYQPRSQCSLLPALRSERERKSKTVSNGWPSGLCVPQLIIYTYLTFSAPSPHPWPLDKDNTASVEGEERLPPRFWHRWFYFCSRLVGIVISLFAPPLPFQQVARGVGRRDRQRFQTELLALEGGGGYSHIWAI